MCKRPSFSAAVKTSSTTPAKALPAAVSRAMQTEICQRLRSGTSQRGRNSLRPAFLSARPRQSLLTQRGRYLKLSVGQTSSGPTRSMPLHDGHLASGPPEAEPPTCLPTRNCKYQCSDPNRLEVVGVVHSLLAVLTFLVQRNFNRFTEKFLPALGGRHLGNHRASRLESGPYWRVNSTRTRGRSTAA